MPIVHVDAYHVRHLADLEAAGFEEMSGDGRVTVVEWGDRIASALPADRLETTLTPVADDHAGASPSPTSSIADVARRVEVVALGPSSERVLERFAAGMPRNAGAATERGAARAGPP